MPQLPSQLLNGENKNDIFLKFNQLLEYLGTLRIIGDNRTISVQRTPAGYVVSAIRQPGSGNANSDDAAVIPSGYDGMFAVSVEEENGSWNLKVRGGMIELEGIAIPVEDFPPVQIEAGETRYAMLTIAADGSTSIAVSEDSGNSFRGDSWQIRLACLTWSGSVCSVTQDQYGIIRLWRPGMGWGLFRTEIRDGKISVCSGFAWLNGMVKPVDSAELETGTGYVCVCADFNKDTGWGQPRIELKSAPDEKSFPVAFIGDGGNGVPAVQNFGVSLAILTATAVCPIAAGAAENE